MQYVLYYLVGYISLLNVSKILPIRETKHKSKLNLHKSSSSIQVNTE